jgi:hypothetical protein
MAYDPELPGCFGDHDLIFASHPLDRHRAFEWLIRLRSRDATWSEAKTQIEGFLRSKEIEPFHILDQIERAELLLKVWLYGPGNDE